METITASGKERVKSGITTAKNCEEVFEKIVKNVTYVGTMVEEIAVASQEQTQGIDEISKSVTQLEQVALQNSSTSHHAATSAGDLRTQVDELHSMVTQLNQTVYGKNAA